MNRKQYLGLALLILLAYPLFAFAQGMASMGNVSGCNDFGVILFNSATKAHRCGMGATLVYRASGVNLNAGANTDSGSTFTGLPSRYIVRRLTFDNASCTPTLSTVALRTAAAGGGTAIVTAQALSTLSASTTLVDSSLAVTTTALTASTLYLRNVAATGGVCTADATLEITPLL